MGGDEGVQGETNFGQYIPTNWVHFETSGPDFVVCSDTLTARGIPSSKELMKLVLEMVQYGHISFVIFGSFMGLATLSPALHLYINVLINGEQFHSWLQIYIINALRVF